MVRLWPTSLTAAMVLCVSLGCANQNLQGRWRGPFPLEDAKACVLNLYAGSRFDLACQDHLWIGGGRYDEVPEGLVLEFDILAKRDQRVARPPTFRLEMDQKGNELWLHVHHGESYRLRRGL